MPSYNNGSHLHRFLLGDLGDQETADGAGRPDPREKNVSSTSNISDTNDHGSDTDDDDNGSSASTMVIVWRARDEAILRSEGLLDNLTLAPVAFSQSSSTTEDDCDTGDESDREENHDEGDSDNGESEDEGLDDGSSTISDETVDTANIIDAEVVDVVDIISEVEINGTNEFRIFEEFMDYMDMAPLTRISARQPTTDELAAAAIRKPIEGDCCICITPLQGCGGEVVERRRSIDHTHILWCKAQCGNNFHMECMSEWGLTASLQYRAKTCPVCRVRWVE